MSGLGICGAHRTGKTTLAKTLSDRLDIPFVPISASDIFAKRYLDPAKPMDFRTRLSVQQEILNHAEDIWFDIDEPSFICDRTPIDMAAYLLTGVGNREMDDVNQEAVIEYLEKCFVLAKRYFSKFLLVPPTIPLVPCFGKAAISKPLIFSLHYQILGMLSEIGVNYQVILGGCLEIGDRVDFAEKFWIK